MHNKYFTNPKSIHDEKSQQTINIRELTLFDEEHLQKKPTVIIILNGERLYMYFLR